MNSNHEPLLLDDVHSEMPYNLSQRIMKLHLKPSPFLPDEASGTASLRLRPAACHILILMREREIINIGGSGLAP